MNFAAKVVKKGNLRNKNGSFLNKMQERRKNGSYLLKFRSKSRISFCEVVKPDAVSIDYNVNAKLIVKEIKIPVQGGLNPNVLLSDKENIKKEALKYLDIFKDHPYIFNLGR